MADANAKCSQPHRAVVARSAIYIKRTSFPGGAIGIKRVAIRYSIVFVARKLSAGADANDPPARFQAFAAG